MLANNKYKYSDIKESILGISTYEDTVKILSVINKYLVSDSNNQDLKAMRQKVYDTRRRLGLSAPSYIPQSDIAQTPQKLNRSISYADIFNLSCFGMFSAAAAGMIFVQSLEICSRIGFDSPILTASGSLLVICASSVIRAIKPSKVTLLLCLYILSFESYMLIYGTNKSEENHMITESAAAFEIKLKTQKENMERAEAAYLENKSDWYRVKYLAPARKEYSDTLQAISEIKRKPVVSSGFSYLKILYRLSLLFIFTISVSYLIIYVKRLFTL